MPYLNKVILMGHAGRDGTLKETKAGPMLSFSIATSEGKGERKVTIWHNITLFGKSVEWTSVSKGDLVLVEGRITKREHEGNVYPGVMADRVMNLSAKPKGNKFEQEEEVPY
jgi:single-stranded DNA-binding protein